LELVTHEEEEVGEGGFPLYERGRVKILVGNGSSVMLAARY
jgi:hypothetical protein